MDTLVFDIETKNFFTDPGVGWNNFEALKVSAVGVYSYEKNEYRAFGEGELHEASEYFRNASRLVGFSMNRYDIPVLVHHFAAIPGAAGIDLWAKERVDLLEAVEAASGSRVSLGKLAEANLGMGKTGSGAEAIRLYQEGKIEELKAYCLMDVRLTKELYDLYRTKGEFLVPERNSDELTVVRFPEAASEFARLF